jgi:integrase
MKSDGSYRTRDDGRIELRATVGGKRRSFYGWTKREARASHAEYLRKHHLGEFAKSGDLTLNQFWMEYLEHLETVQREISDLTRLDYERTWTRNFHTGIGEMRLEDITPTDITGAMKRIAARFKTGTGHRTLEYAYVLLKACLEHAVNLELLPRNPAARVPRPKRVHVERDFYTRDELRRYLEAGREERLFAGVMLAVASGLRRAELLGFRDADLDLETGRYTIRNTVRHVTGRGYVFKSPKSGKPRVVKLSADLLALIQTRMEQRDLERQTAGGGWHEYGLLFTAANGKPIESKTLWRSHARIAKNAKLRHVSVHELRHTYATLAVAKGVDEKALSQAMGHASVAFTRMFYQHVLEEQLEAASLSMADLLEPTKREETQTPKKRSRGTTGVKRPGVSGKQGTPR